MPTAPRAFLSYRTVDRDRVRTIAETLRTDFGIDAWWDVWEIRPGDDFVRKINDGLEQCDCGVVFLSAASLDGVWQTAEVSILKAMWVDDKRPLIPVLLDPDVKVPAILRSHSFFFADQIPQLAAAILNRSANKPILGHAPSSPTRSRFSIHLRDIPGSAAIGVSAELDGKPLVTEQSVMPGQGFVYSYADFLRGRLHGYRFDSMEAVRTTREQDLVKLGDAVGNLVFAGEIDKELSALLNGIPSDRQEVELSFEVAGSRLLGIPFEAARLADGRIPALANGVFSWRGPARGKPLLPQSPGPGPLRILVAVGAPDEGKTPNPVLGSERELEVIFAAVDQAQKRGSAYVRVLEVGHPDQIGDALRELSYHVLHLSGHGNKGILELEDEDGNPVPTTPDQLARKITDSGHPPPLIVLASCHGGTGDHEAGSFAQGLLDRGVPAVLAMQTAVSDYYATELAGKFYAHLAQDEQPFASRALALARRDLEEIRKTNAPDLLPVARLPEYATPSLFLRGEEQAVLDRALDQVRVPDKPRPPASAAVPMLSIGQLIGRRREARQIVRALTDDPKSLAAIGRKAGCQILGTGGVGKSTLAGRVMQRMADRGWTVATVSGNWNVSKIATALAAQFWNHPAKELQELAHALAGEAPDELRLQWLQTLLAHLPVLLVLDNFEDNLVPGGGAFLDSVTEQIFGFLLEFAQRSRILITCRYPVPGGEARLLRIDLGPLSPAETSKKRLRLEGLRELSSDHIKLLERAIGGHPRTLEYLDALLRSGATNFPAITNRIVKFAAQEGVSLTSAAPFEERVRDAIILSAADAMVAELVRLLAKNPEDLPLLWQASVFPFAVPTEALIFDPAHPDLDDTDPATHGPALPASGPISAPLAAAISRLTASSLLTPREDNHIYVHRWTAESLKHHAPAGRIEACCLVAARYLTHRVNTDRSPQPLTDFIESVYLFLQARAFDDAAALAWQLIVNLTPRGLTTLSTELAHTVGSALPFSHDDKSRLLREEGDGLRKLGMSHEARVCYQEALHQDEQKVAREPGHADYLRDLSVSYTRMGNLESSVGHGESARQFYEKDLEIAEQLVAQEPDRADYHHDLSVSYNKMGDQLLELGQKERAREFYQRSLEIRERLVAQESGNSDFQRRLSVSCNKMGDLLFGLEQAEPAREFYQRSLDICERLVTQEPGRTDFQRDFSISCNKMGDLLLALGQRETAHELHQKSLDICERLAAQEPGRADYLVDLAIALVRIATLANFERALEILLSLKAANRLSPADEPKIENLRRLIQLAKDSGTESPS